MQKETQFITHASKVGANGRKRRICDEENCTSVAKRGGKCQKHGAKPIKTPTSNDDGVSMESKCQSNSMPESVMITKKIMDARKQPQAAKTKPPVVSLPQAKKRAPVPLPTVVRKSKGGSSKDRPYSEYSIFFILENAHVNQSAGIIDQEVVSFLDPNHKDDLELPRPKKYENLVLPPYWYSRAHKSAIEKKRKHRKRGTANRMNMKELSKMISHNWRNADDETRQYCKKLANAQLRKHNRLSQLKNQIKKPLPDGML